PLPSTTSVPLGTRVVLLGPTEWIRPFRTNTVISLFGAPPVPSISLTPVIANIAEGFFCGSAKNSWIVGFCGACCESPNEVDPKSNNAKQTVRFIRFALLSKSALLDNSMLFSCGPSPGSIGRTPLQPGSLAPPRQTRPWCEPERCCLDHRPLSRCQQRPACCHPFHSVHPRKGGRRRRPTAGRAAKPLQ